MQLFFEFFFLDEFFFFVGVVVALLKFVLFNHDGGVNGWFYEWVYRVLLNFQCLRSCLIKFCR